MSVQNAKAGQTAPGVAKERVGGLVAIPPTPFGKYTLVGTLGRGGMAEVNLGVAAGKAGFRKLTVIKKLHAHLALEPGFVDMFLDEARLAARLNHPNCVQTNEVGEFQGQHFLAMEYLDGVGLERLLRQAGETDEVIPYDIAARIVADALDGLAYAHELTDYDGTPLSIIHRDISPQNIYVTYNGMVKLLDFGIAKASTQVVETRTGVIKGKYAYIAPEQALAKKLDQRADIWSMGVVLWETLTARRLFKSINELATLYETLNSEIKPPSTYVPGLPQELDDITMKSLQRDPDLRYQEAGDFRDDLERFLAHLPRPPRRKQVAKLMRIRFADVIEHHKATLRACLEGTATDASIQQLVDPATSLMMSGEMAVYTPSGIHLPPSGSYATPSGSHPLPGHGSHSGVRAAPTTVPPSDSYALPPGTIPPAEEKRGAGLWWKVALIAAVMIIGVLVALLIPNGDDPGTGGAISVVGQSGQVTQIPGTQLPDESGSAGSPSGGESAAGSSAAGNVAGNSAGGNSAAGNSAAGNSGNGATGEEGSGSGSAAGENSVVAQAGEEEAGGEEGEELAGPAGRRRHGHRRGGRRAGGASQAAEGPSESQPDPQPEAQAAAPQAAFGFLTLATTPWTDVSIGSRELGTTPLIRVRLPAGSHTLRLRNQQAGINTTYRVDIQDGQTVTRRLGLN